MDGVVSRADLILELYTKNGITLTKKMSDTLNKRLLYIELSDGLDGFSEPELATVYHLYQMLTNSNKYSDHCFKKAVENDLKINSKSIADKTDNCMRGYFA